MQLLLDNVETLRLIRDWTMIRFPGLAFEEETRLDTWCKDYSSTGRYTTTCYLNANYEEIVDFYFEKEEDAIMFSLSQR